jgi:hypothetical protein
MKLTKLLAILTLAFGLMICVVKVIKAAPIGTTFTYQGRLIDNNVAAEGEYDFQFRLFDSDAGGSQVGSDVSIVDVNVIDGYFTIELDFGSVFTGEARWLEISVRDGDSTGDFTTLSPRQKITAVPYAIHADFTGEINSVVGGRISGMPPAIYPFEFDISRLGDVQASEVMIVASGSKLTGAGEPETPLMIKWEVSDSPLTVAFRVWDSYGEQYSPVSGGWMGRQIEMSFAAFDPNTEGVLSDGNVLSGKFEYTVNDTPTMPFEIPISGFDVDDVNSINVVTSGIRHEAGGIATPLAVKGAVVDSSGLKLNLWAWDINGDEPDDNYPAWDGKTLEVSYAIIGPTGSTGTVGADKVVTDLNLDSDGNIITGAIPQEDYYGTVTRIYLRDLTNLKERLGGSGITLAEVNDSIKKIMLSAQTYSEATQVNFIGFRWARVSDSAIGIDETDIYWPIKVYEDEHTATEDSSATYKLMRVEAHFK